MQRKRRGWAENNELFPYKEKQLAELIELLSSKEAHERTISAKLLPINCDTVNILLHSLMKEPALYTRLAITEKLESGDSMTAQQMIPFLAEIGTNQHRFPVAPSKKIFSLAARFDCSFTGTYETRDFSSSFKSCNTASKFEAAGVD